MLGLTGGWLTLVLVIFIVSTACTVGAVADRWERVAKERERTHQAREQTTQARLAFEAKKLKHDARMVAEWKPPKTG